MEIIREHCTDRGQADALVAVLYRRKALKWFLPDRFPGFRPERQRAWVRVVRNLQDSHVPPRVDALLPLVHRMRSILVRKEELAALVSIGAAAQAGRPLEAVLTGSTIELRVAGLMARPALAIAPGFRLVPADQPLAGLSRSSVRGRIRTVATRLGWSIARRSARGRRTWFWARRHLTHRGRR
jgi:hypothetical protein